jgi:hypothetical protein
MLAIKGLSCSYLCCTRTDLAWLSPIASSARFGSLLLNGEAIPVPLRSRYREAAQSAIVL